MCALSGLWRVVLVLAATCAVLGLGAVIDNNKHSAGPDGGDSGSGPSNVRTKRLTTFGKSSNMPSPPPLSAGIVVGASGIKECRTTLDCEMIQYTECRTDPREGRSVCLCMDNALPVNGACSARPRDTRGYVPFGNRRPNKEAIAQAEYGVEHAALVTWDRPPLFRPHEETNTQPTKLSSHVPTIFRPSLRKTFKRKALRTPCNSDNECLEGAECVINPNATVNINQRMCYCMPGWLEVDGYCNGSSICSASILITLTFAVLVATYSQI